MDTTAPGTPCWIELVTPDRDRAAAFYGALFGWTTTAPEADFGGYSQWAFDGRPLGGLMPETDGMTGPPMWSVYLATPDAEKFAALATEHGGSVMVPPMEIPGMGSMVVVTDASGLTHCAWQAAPFAGFETDERVGEPIWAEAYTDDFATTRAFLTDVAEWDVTMAADGDDFRYGTNGPEAVATAGLMDVSRDEGMAPGWAIYVRVADMAATLARATELGGSVRQGPDDTPYGVLATIADPDGVTIKVMVPPAG